MYGDEVYQSITIFRSDKEALEEAVSTLCKAGCNTDIPCVIQSLIDGWLTRLVEEELET